MPIRQDDNQPTVASGSSIYSDRLWRFAVVQQLHSKQWHAAGATGAYSLFIDQVNDGAVKRAYITQDQIRYELLSPEGAPPVLATTPIFDMDLPQRLNQRR